MLRSEYVSGEELVGREVMVCWDDDVWYDAVVIRYLPEVEKYKLVYRMDDGIEVTGLRDRRWMLCAKKTGGMVLDGAVIEFEWPKDRRRYQAMVYDYSADGRKLLVAYVEDDSTDCLTGGGWEFVKESPCRADGGEKMEEKVEEKTGKGKVGGARKVVAKQGPRQGGQEGGSGSVRRSPRFAEEGKE